MFTQDELTKMHDRMADILCYLSGFETGILANPNGNQKTRQAMLEMSSFIKSRALEQKNDIKKHFKP